MEAYASVDGLRNRLSEESPHYIDMQLSQILAIKSADELVAGHIAFGQKMLCYAVAGAAIALDPELIVLGGGGMDVGLYSIADIKKDIYELLPEVNRSRVQIIQASHGNKAGVIGAILLMVHA
jgi:predicted NBD/HSP70 family sugar kinase